MEEIIIDGVDVNECTYSIIGIDKHCYCEEQLYDDGTPVCQCKDNNDCYYKQLKRKEAECEELKKQNDYLSMSCECFKKDYFELSREKEELKTSVNLLEDQLIKRDDLCDMWCDIAKKYEQALEKIERIVTDLKTKSMIEIKNKPISGYYIPSEMHYGRCEAKIEVANSILNIIKECKE